MPEDYSLQALDSDLYTLALKMNEIDNLEQTVDQFWAAAAVQAIPIAGTAFWQLYSAIQAQNEARVISADSELLGSLPDRCRRIVGIDPLQFEGAKEHFESVAYGMVDLQGAPGNVLSNIGSWNGTAAEAFETYFTGYEPAQSRQAALLAAEINACISLTALVGDSKIAVKSLLESSIKLADEMIETYKETLKALTVGLVAAVVTIAAAGFAAVAATGATAALAVTGTGAGAVGSLISSVYGFEQAYGQIEGKNREELLSSISDNLRRLEETVSTADQEIFDDLETICAQWNIGQIAIPAPPGGDEISGDSFYHESAY
ncbi:hypothetical protein [Glycomyces algeriensis]|uniref:Uncharacterized protein n=1 Tax=Glycomyces algeriensis TaxID=256037 RepID=A0A9W6LFI4_9ACTN|nr:hypothetical protein [Glycomyces algeriensis]MDA1367183.1 hypothetical protein [Glycomyces algeriensis]MDR7353433.1 uncharacterized protein YukE [Glycomyces algeriensis]GLI41130.1 hypothetical protein GALLR39Z86_09800 [Glycomyces algeriensis]